MYLWRWSRSLNFFASCVTESFPGKVFWKKDKKLFRPLRGRPVEEGNPSAFGRERVKILYHFEPLPRVVVPWRCVMWHVIIMWDERDMTCYMWDEKSEVWGVRCGYEMWDARCEWDDARCEMRREMWKMRYETWDARCEMVMCHVRLEMGHVRCVMWDRKLWVWEVRCECEKWDVSVRSEKWDARCEMWDERWKMRDVISDKGDVRCLGWDEMYVRCARLDVGSGRGEGLTPWAFDRFQNSPPPRPHFNPSLGEG